MFSDAYITSVPRDSQVPVRGLRFVDSESKYQQLKGACLPSGAWQPGREGIF